MAKINLIVRIKSEKGKLKNRLLIRQLSRKWINIVLKLALKYRSGWV